MSAALRSLMAHWALRLWPLNYGLETLMALVDPPTPTQTLATKRLRGFPLQLRFNPRTYMGQFLYYRGLYEDGLVLKLRQLLRPGMTFLDIGANIGLYSVIAAHLVGPSGRVVAFEPQEGLAGLFEQNLKLNRLGNVIHQPIALGRTNGAANLFQVTPNNDGQATLRLRADERGVGTPRPVIVRRLADVLGELNVVHVDGLKIDVEGGELEVLEGFQEWIAAAPPRFIFVECIDSHLKRFGRGSHDLIEFLDGHGYTAHRLSRGRWLPVAARVPSSPNGFRADLLALRTGTTERASSRQ